MNRKGVASGNVNNTYFISEKDQGEYYYVYGPYVEPKLRVDPGARITFETHDAFEGKIQKETDKPSPASDMALIFGFMKLLDPTSTVREGEYATVQNATGIPGRVTNAYNNAIDGLILKLERLRFSTCILMLKEGRGQ